MTWDLYAGGVAVSMLWILLGISMKELSLPAILALAFMTLLWPLAMPMFIVWGFMKNAK